MVKKACAHKFQIGDKMLISNDFYTGKNPKLAPSLNGPGVISPFCGGGCQVASVGFMMGQSFHFVLLGGVTFLDDNHGVGDPCQQLAC